MSENLALENYRKFLARLDLKFGEIRSDRPADFRCGRGCHSCCLPGLTVSAVERENIARFLASEPGRLKTVRETSARDPHRGSRCRFLDAAGACMIYEVRPVVCRSHGAPLKFRAEGASGATDRDVCPLNFAGQPLEALPDSLFIDIDTLNTILAAIQLQFRPEGDPEERTALSPDAILPE